MLISLLILAAALGAGTALWLGHRRRARRPDPKSALAEASTHRREVHDAPLLSAPLRPGMAARTNGSSPSNGAPAAPPVPPARAVAWAAEVDWREVDGTARFQVVARRVRGGDATVIAESEPLEWPPTTADAVEALTAAADRLEATLLAAGWVRLPPGSAWYARRFGWEPAPAPRRSARPAPAPALTRAPQPQPQPRAPQPRAPQPRPRESPEQLGRFDRPRPWPAEAADRWRCEIAWAPGYVHARFRAVAYRPGSEKGRPIGESAELKWGLMADPIQSDPAQRRELRRLAAALLAAGWEPAGIGTEWYAGRYVWPGDGLPPDRLELAPSERRSAS